MVTLHGDKHAHSSLPYFVLTNGVLPSYTLPGGVTLPPSVLRMSICVSLLSRVRLGSAFIDVGPKVLMSYCGHT